jgi:hypothetical protein
MRQGLGLGLEMKRDVYGDGGRMYVIQYTSKYKRAMEWSIL